MKYKAVLFDLDGTLIDSIPDLADAANAMRRDFGLPELSYNLISNYIGKGFDLMMIRVLQHGITNQTDELAPESAMPANNQSQNTDDLSSDLFNPELIKQALASARQHYGKLNGNKSRLYPDLIAGLDKFKQMDVKLAVVTNKSEKYTLPLLKKMGLTDYFDEIVSGDTCTRKKPDPMQIYHACDLLGVTPQQALFIGDSINDALAAKAAGSDMLVLPYGYNEGQPVQNLPANAIVDTILLAADWALKQN